MKRINFCIADPEISYIEMASTYIRSSEFAKQFVVKSFTKMDVLNQYIQSGSEIDILLISEQFHVSDLDLNNIATTVITLMDSPSDSEKSVFKYQPVNKILKAVIAQFESGNSVDMKKSTHHEGTKVISFFSAVGGAGKTTTSINLVRQLSFAGKKVFYLNLELLNSTSLFFPSDDKDNSSELLYLLKAKPSLISKEAVRLKKIDPMSDVEYFDFIMSGEEMSELTRDEVKLMIHSLKDMKYYDYILIDLDSSLEERNLGALQSSDYIYFILTNDIYSMIRTSKMINEIKRLSNNKGVDFKLRFVLNKYLGPSGGETQKELIQICNEQHHITFDFYLPYIPSWKLIHKPNQLFVDPTFNEEIVNMMERI